MEDSGTNINSLWLLNIFENIKNIEVYERMARNGCRDILNYIQIPKESRQRELSEAQYQNLMMFGNELMVMLPDFASNLDKEVFGKYNAQLTILTNSLRLQKSKYYKENISIPRKTIINTYLTEDFYSVLNIFAEMRRELLLKVEPLLFIKEQSKPVGMDKSKTLTQHY